MLSSFDFQTIVWIRRKRSRFTQIKRYYQRTIFSQSEQSEGLFTKIFINTIKIIQPNFEIVTIKGSINFSTPQLLIFYFIQFILSLFFNHTRRCSGSTPSFAERLPGLLRAPYGMPLGDRTQVEASALPTGSGPSFPYFRK